MKKKKLPEPTTTILYCNRPVEVICETKKEIKMIFKGEKLQKRKINDRLIEINTFSAPKESIYLKETIGIDYVGTTQKITGQRRT